MSSGKRSCQIIPIEQYDKILKVVAEDDKHRYVLNDMGHIIKLRRKTCFSCPKSANFVIIFTYAKHKRVERFCKEHAQQFTNNGQELPVMQQEQLELVIDNLTSKQKLALAAMQKWNNIKVNI